MKVEDSVVKRLVKKAALRVLNLSEIQVDPSYQRDVKPIHLKIMTEFNEQALGVPIVAEREDGSLWVVDGLQRCTALKKLNHTTIRAEVIASTGSEYEAAIFKIINADRAKLTSGDMFKARLTAHDPLAWSIKETVEQCGFRLRYSGGKNKATNENSWRELVCLNTLLRICKDGVDVLIFVLKTVEAAWPGDVQATTNQLVDGLAIFYNRYKKIVDIDRLVNRLQTVTPRQLIYAANQSSLGNSISFAVADQIDKVYKKRQGVRKKT